MALWKPSDRSFSGLVSAFSPVAPLARAARSNFSYSALARPVRRASSRTAMK
jgi:hypothetical protein